MTDEELRRNLDLDQAIRRSLGEVDYGVVLRAEGTTAVGLDGDGRMVRVLPDGTVRQLY